MSLALIIFTQIIQYLEILLFVEMSAGSHHRLQIKGCTCHFNILAHVTLIISRVIFKQLLLKLNLANYLKYFKLFKGERISLIVCVL